MAQSTEKIQEIKDGKPNLTQNLLMVNSILEEMIANNDRGNTSMLAAARRLTLEAHSQMDALISLKQELQAAVNQPMWSGLMGSDLRKPNAILADIDVILNLLGSNKA